jgi:hypothetical protein
LARPLLKSRPAVEPRTQSEHHPSKAALRGRSEIRGLRRPAPPRWGEIPARSPADVHREGPRHRAATHHPAKPATQRRGLEAPIRAAHVPARGWTPGGAPRGGSRRLRAAARRPMPLRRSTSGVRSLTEAPPAQSSELAVRREWRGTAGCRRSDPPTRSHSGRRPSGRSSSNGASPRERGGRSSGRLPASRAVRR